MSGWQNALKAHWRGILIGALLVAFAAPLCRRSIVLADEGYVLLQSLDLLHGKVLYRDMDAFVTPGVWLVLAGTFAVLGPSVIASRVPVLGALLLMYATSWRITARLAGERYAVACLVVMAACTVWAFPGWTFAFYSPFAVTFALLALSRLLAYRDDARTRHLVFVGAYVGLSIAFKQNYGVFAAVGIAAGLAAVLLERAPDAEPPFARALAAAAIPLAAGVALVGLPLVAWLGAAGALPAAWQALVVHPFEFSGRHDIPFLRLSALFEPGVLQSGAEMLTYAAQPIYRVPPPPSAWLREVAAIERLHALFYWVPPVMLAAGAALSYRPDAGARDATGGAERVVDAGLFAVVALAGAMFLGVFPRADFNHLTNVYQPVVVAGVVVAHCVLARRRVPSPWWQRALFGVAGAVLASVVAVAAFWYYGLMKYLATPVPVDRAGVLDRSEQAMRIAYQVEAIRAATEPGEAVLTLPDLSMLNFLADRPMPSAYYNMYEHHIAHDGGAAVVRGTEEHGVRLAITRFNDFFSDRVGLRDYAPELVRYLATHFEMQHYVGNEDFIVFRRRDEPIAPPKAESLLPYCDTTAGYQDVRYHLLFPALYHNPGTGHNVPAAAVETRCAVDVPDRGAVLRVRIGYRAPAVVVQNTTLTAEIVALAPEGSGELNELLLEKTFRVKGQGPDVLKKPLFETFDVDLSRHAGQRVDLVLRTTRVGKVLLRVLENRGFGTSWEDPVLIARDGTPAR